VAVTAPEVVPAVPELAPHVEPRRIVDESEKLYRAAHELHFHGDDVAAALAAWDAYLAASPHGAFAVEARYNRAVCLVRLDRLAEARTALAPFAAGEVAPAGYRRDEAARLIERIDRRLANSVNGSP
jgi:TolA-binding protein